MMNDINKGDIVKCINEKNSLNKLKENKVYRVTHYFTSENIPYISLNGEYMWSWDAERFARLNDVELFLYYSYGDDALIGG